MARTEAEMKEILKDKLFVGKTVRIERWTTKSEKAGVYKYRESKKGEVVALYPHIFTVRIGRILENFRYSQVFEKGGERVILS